MQGVDVAATNDDSVIYYQWHLTLATFRTVRIHSKELKSKLEVQIMMAQKPKKAMDLHGKQVM